MTLKFNVSLVYNNNQGITQELNIDSTKSEYQNTISFLKNLIAFARQQSSGGSSFKDLLTSTTYSKLSDDVKAFLQQVEIADTQGDGSQASYKIDVSSEGIDEPEYLLQGVPTDDYLNELRAMDELDFKIRELMKHYDKMDRISGNMDMREMLLEASGTSQKLSNIDHNFNNAHVTDLDRLNNLRIDSAVFS